MRKVGSLLLPSLLKKKPTKLKHQNLFLQEKEVFHTFCRIGLVLLYETIELFPKKQKEDQEKSATVPNVFSQDFTKW